MIGILYGPCGMPISFDDMRVAAEFVKMLAEIITPDQWVAYIQATVPDHVDAAKALATACMGSPS